MAIVAKAGSRAGSQQKGWQLAVKSLVDRACAALLLALLAPVLGAIALLVWITMGRPVLLQQVRPGGHGRPFRLIKFRTMADRRKPAGDMLPDEMRLSRVGRFLRSTSLDEFPELWNVLRGEMSLVGPRALLMEYLDRYTPEQARRHDVVPGITGWAQVNGRNALSWPEKLSLDLWYVDHWSLRLDLKILFRTIWTVIKREGISQPGHSTMPEFLGSENPKP
jgi:sugar transferase EpsL